MLHWKIKSQGNEEARQQFLEGYVPQIWEIGLTVPDPNLCRSDNGVWEYTEPDWDELKEVVTGYGLRSAERLPPSAAATSNRNAGCASSCRRRDAGLRSVQAGEEGPGVPARGVDRRTRLRVRGNVVRAGRYGRRGESEALWLVPRESVHEVVDFPDEFDLKYRRVDGYSLKAKVEQLREESLQLPALSLTTSKRRSWPGAIPSGPGSPRHSRRTSLSLRSRRTRSGTRARSTSFSPTMPTHSPSTASLRSTAARRSSSCGCSTGRTRSRGATSTSRPTAERIERLDGPVGRSRRRRDRAQDRPRGDLSPDARRAVGRDGCATSLVLRRPSKSCVPTSTATATTRTPEFTEALDEMTSVRRSAPGAEW